MQGHSQAFVKHRVSRITRVYDTAPEDLTDLAAKVRACRICRDSPGMAPLPHEPRPVLQVSGLARLCICGQAPGTRVHASGRPFTDPSGDRLRRWMGIDEQVFYDAGRLAIVPMGFCFPGLDAKGGDLPPRPECRNAWHDRIFAAMPRLELIVLIGQYAQAYHLGSARKKSLTETVASWSEILNGTRSAGRPALLPLPHPSWRNNAWLKRNPWFEAELVPVLQSQVARLTS
ncbi:uracil-DNA glycosylase family protein [Roseibium sp. RKSG952]|uniref:uracil-DNA glycosylase family protein n=1 Tax=Roseibium sp. RKSG952 TaxID=2529384 RepID=UPI0012BD3B7D|nr:uracil-DNA glycosylase family protein [Roseibium sp. RKSG952]MTH97553.1 uracil-DNA glycosylase family protein [Roseibium sp. RKSG952]